jgi:Protein of unknown function (DUF2934)
MSSPARSFTGALGTSGPKPEVLGGEDSRDFLQEFHSLVARRAYELFEQDGGADGNHVEHWLDAERQLATPLPDVRESAGSFTAALSLGDVLPGGTKVYTTQDRAIVCCETDLSGNSDGPYQGRETTYYMIRWPEIVDPRSCSVGMDGRDLIITVRKAEIESNAAAESTGGL